MISLNDQDQELLEAYMDGNLPADDEQEMCRRLDAEPALAPALETLRAEAHVRFAVWKGYEPNDHAVHRLVARIDAAVDRHTIWAHRLSRLRMIGSAAACIVLGLLVGRIFPWNGSVSDDHTPSIQHTTSVDLNGSGVSMPRPSPQPNGPVQFRIVDSNGNPITLQPFKTQKEANEFLRDITNWQRQQEQLRDSGTTLPSSGQF